MERWWILAGSPICHTWEVRGASRDKKANPQRGCGPCRKTRVPLMHRGSGGVAKLAEDAASEVRTLIERCHSVELQVVAITSDMGSGNRAMWKQFGIHTGRYSRTVSLIPHPQVPGEQIAFLADVPHLIKNLNGHLVLAELQKNLAFKLAPKLRSELLDPNHFEKMK
ncbi:hypothetical protein HPB47_019483, partial [Ixodes persulcatus]